MFVLFGFIYSALSHNSNNHLKEVTVMFRRMEVNKALLVLLLLSSFCFSGSVHAAVEGDYVYTVNGSEATITNYTGSDKSIVIPDTLGGFPVTTIWNQAFVAKGLTSVVIPSTVHSIRSEAFEGNHLTNIVIPSSVTYLGGETFGYNTLTKVRFEGSYATFPFYNPFPGNQGNPANLTIEGYICSPAKKLADTHGYTFVPLDYDISLVEGFNVVSSHSYAVSYKSGQTAGSGCFFPLAYSVLTPQ